MIISKTSQYLSKVSIREGDKQYTYQELLSSSSNLAGLISSGRQLQGERVCFMVPPGFDYVKTLFAIWMTGGIAVPLALSYPTPQLEYVVDDTKPALIIASEEYLSKLGLISTARELDLINVSKVEDQEINFNSYDKPDTEEALILYTSGTTSKPKGVVISHQNIKAQVLALTQAWKWNSEDHILCTLPLHHIHGIVNIICCALWSGACCEFLPRFDEAKVLDIFRKGQVNLFMAVPTIYYKLIGYYDTLPKDDQEEITDAMRQFRLMVSGSAALPVTVLERWKEISNHILLERYGMTEIGMALSNPYDGQRRPGYVGSPLPGVEIRLVDENGSVVASEAGEIQVKGDTVFNKYWNRQNATREAFTEDGWFKTGDLATVDEGYYKILGRLSVDIIKTGGYKVSALEIEEIMRTHPLIKDCGVVGVEDIEWGERIVAAVVCTNEIIENEIIAWLKERLPAYKVPRSYKFVEDLPRNAMGKVTKNEIKNYFG